MSVANKSTSSESAFTLDQVPGGEALEDRVAAILRSAGHVVETRISRRMDDGTEILELDGVASHYEDGPPAPIVLEAKSGGWGFSDAFKVLGWMSYLGLKKGVLFVADPPRRSSPENVAKMLKSHGMQVVVVDSDEKQTCERVVAAGFPAPDRDLIVPWRFSARIERCLVAEVRPLRKGGAAGPGAVLGYLNMVNDRIFFVADVRQRLYDLYDEYKKHPKLALAVATELDGHVFNLQQEGRPSTAFNDAMYKAKHPAIQTAWYVEHRARLAIMKAAVDYIVLDDAGLLPNDGMFDALLDESLPRSFHEGLAALRLAPSLRRYPLLWQFFLWCMGGFVLEKYEQEEFALLSKASGVPVKEIPNALGAYELLFPRVPWWGDFGGRGLRFMKSLPVAFYGLGSWFRTAVYKKTANELGLDDLVTAKLVEWHNEAYRLLKANH